MRKFLVVIACGLFAVGGGASSAEATHSGPELRTFGKGTALFGGVFVERFTFDARLGPHEATDPFGEPHGHMKLVATSLVDPTFFLEVTADVTCLTVVGNRATIGGRIKSVDASIDGRRGLLFTATDNTVDGFQLTPDAFAGTRVVDVPQICPPPGVDSPLIEGDIVIQQG